MNLECAAVITKTGNSFVVQSSRGILRGGNHEIALRGITGAQVIRSAGSIGPVLGTQPPNVVAEPADRASPLNPLSQQRCRHIRGLLKQRPHPAPRTP